MTPLDHLPPQRRPLGDASGRAKPERLSEYFDFNTFPEKRDRKVTRGELLAILTRKWRVESESRWYVRLWTYLTAKRGSEPRPVGGGTEKESA